MHHVLRPALLLAPCLALLGACNKNEGPTGAGTSDAVAVVNGEPIERSRFDLYVENLTRQSGRQPTEEQRAEMLDQLISMQLATEAAEKSGLADKPRVQDQIELARMNVIADAALREFMESHPVADEELKPEYDQQVAAMPREYHARHILVEEKTAAEEITKKVKAGADFAKLAEQRSKDPSAQSGGDLGWFTLDTMVKPFGDAVAALQPGQTTDQPVQSQFGWHVIKLEDSRASTPPAFDDVKEQVRSLVQRKKLQAYLEGLRKEAKVEKKL